MSAETTADESADSINYTEGRAMIALEQFQQAVANAHPGSVVEVAITLRVTVPTPDQPISSTPGAVETEEAVSDDRIERSGAVLSIDPARRSPIEQIMAYVAHHSDALRKAKDWAAEVCSHNGFSARELTNACRYGAVKWERKDDGKDAGAYMIRGSWLVEYLTLREDVRAGKRPRPEWWEDVVSRRKQSVDLRSAA